MSLLVSPPDGDLTGQQVIQIEKEEVISSMSRDIFLRIDIGCGFTKVFRRGKISS